jgi:hypothetical protein
MITTMPRLHRALTVVIMGLFVAGSGILAGEVTNAPPQARAADLSQFDAGNIISDAKFFDGYALSAGEVQSFLNSKVTNCTIDNGQPSHAAGAPYYSSSGALYSTVATKCLKDYTQSTPNMVGQAGLCSPYTGRSSESAATIIANIGEACNVSQKVLLVLLEKEQSLVRDTWPLVRQYDSATGFACYDNGQPCVGGYAGFFYQVWAAALQFQRYGSGSFTWYPVGQVSNILYQANNTSCGTRSTLIANRATAALYYYTPYTPNAAALSAGYGLGDACSAYGNRNFYQLYVDWFGSTQGNPAPKAMTSTPAPTLSQTGPALPGAILKASASGWDSGVSFAYQWLRDGKAISSATSGTYTSTGEDNGKSLSVSVTGSKAGYVTTTKTSTDTVQVAAPSAVPPTDFQALVSARLSDSRAGGQTIDGQMSGTGSISPGQVLRVPILGRNGIPTSGVDSVSLNVTVVAGPVGGFITVFPTGTAVPNASNVNFPGGQTVPNAVTVKIGTDGSISVFAQASSANIIVDINGWYPTAGSFVSFTPARLLDTRPGSQTSDGQYRATGTLGPGQTVKFGVLGRSGVPTSDVSAVSLNVTAVTPSIEGFLTVFPSGVSLPNASNLNFTAGETRANAVISKVGADGTISIYNGGQGTTDLVIDISGWYSKAGGFVSLSPARLLDTRPGSFTIDNQFVKIGAIGSGSTLRLKVLGRAGVPLTGVGAVSLNVTAVTPSTVGQLIVYPSGVPVPNTSNLNFTSSKTVANSVTAKIGADGYINIVNNSTGATNMVVDVNGWFPDSD